jgi:hypothetical protein
MRLKLFNGTMQAFNLNVLCGGYDPETSRVMLIVRGDGDSAGILSLDVAEAHRLAAQISKDTPSVTRVGEPVVDPSADEDDNVIIEGFRKVKK